MNRCRFSQSLLGVVFLSAFSFHLSAQEPAPAPAPAPAPTQGGQQGPGQSSPSPTGPSQPGRGTDPSQRQPIPGQTPTDQQRRFPDMQEMQRIFMLSGKVVMDDGTPPPEPVIIERVCNGLPRPEGYTDSKGRFSIRLGENNAMMMDASVGSDPMSRQGGFGGPGRGGITERDLIGCEIRATLPGFRSDVVSLAGRRSLDNPDVGTIVLRRLAKVDGFTFSATSAYAPKDARKSYEKGHEAAQKKKWPDAEKHLMKAVTDYDKYAMAWYELGVVYQQQNKIEEARNAYNSAIKADAKLITPYAQLTRLAAVEKKWEDAAGNAAKVIKLNPYFSPEVYFMSGVANLNLQKLDEAEEHTREALKMDEKRRNPRIQHLLGVILAQKRDYTGAMEFMRAYLKQVPNAPDASSVQQQLAELERMAASGKEGTPVQAQQ